jgi:hypothetical protein
MSASTIIVFCPYCAMEIAKLAITVDLPSAGPALVIIIVFNGLSGLANCMLVRRVLNASAAGDLGL